MVKLKISFEPPANAHKRVQCFEDVPNFRSEKAVYEMISKVKRTKGHTPGRGTFWEVRKLGSWEDRKIGEKKVLALFVSR